MDPIDGYDVPLLTEDFDVLVSKWAEALWSEGDNKSMLGNGLSGLQHFFLPHFATGFTEVGGHTERGEEASRLHRFRH